MHILLHKLENKVDAIIGPLLIGLLLVIAGELFLGERFEAYSAYADYFEIFIITVFAMDLSFKYARIRKIPLFIRSYWLEILATIPFFLVFRFMEPLGIHELIERGQVAAHESSELQKFEKGTIAIIKEAGRAGRTAKLVTTFRILSRFPRFLKAFPFFEKPSKNHHRINKGKKYKSW